MATKNPRLSAVVEEPLYSWLKENAEKQGVSMSLLVRDLLRAAYEREEDAYWAEKADERMKSFDRSSALSHEQVWSGKK